MGAKPNSKPYTKLINEGPYPSGEVTLSDFTPEAREDGVCRFYPTNSPTGDTYASGGQTKPVFYIEGRHDPKTVIKTWMDANERLVSSVSAWSLHKRIAGVGSEWKDAATELLTFDRDFNGGRHETGGTCPRCDEQYERYLADHLPNCNGGV